MAKNHLQKLACSVDIMEFGVEAEECHSNPDLTSEPYLNPVYVLVLSGIQKLNLNESQPLIDIFNFCIF